MILHYNFLASLTNPINDDLRFIKIIHQPAGEPIQFHCGIHGNHAEFMNASNVNWDFMVRNLKICNPRIFGKLIFHFVSNDCSTVDKAIIKL